VDSSLHVSSHSYATSNSNSRWKIPLKNMFHWSCFVHQKKRMEKDQEWRKFKRGDGHRQLEVCTFLKPMPCYLDRQVISLLSILGILDQAFLLNISLLRLDGALKSNEGAALMVRDHAQKSTTSCMLSVGFNVDRAQEFLTARACPGDTKQDSARFEDESENPGQGGVNLFWSAGRERGPAVRQYQLQQHCQ
jgi:hypothetical protein